MIEEKLSRLIEVLTKKTKEGKVRWKATASPNIFLANFEEIGVTISSVPSTSQVSHGYILNLHNEDGEVIESKVVWPISQSEYLPLEDLFNLARRSANNVEESLDLILRKLES